MSLRVHGLIVGSPDKKRADPAVLKGLCSHVLPSGKQEVSSSAQRLNLRTASRASGQHHESRLNGCGHRR